MLPSSSSYFKQFPTCPGVYLMRDQEGRILYIGKAINLRARIKSYFLPGRDGRPMIPYLTPQICTIETKETRSEEEALLLESQLTKEYQPKYNVLLKDDKTFVSIRVTTSQRWPMITLCHVKEGIDEKDLLFGPYTQAQAARDTVALLHTLFPLRQCSDHELNHRKRPCILHELGKCMAPCCGYCEPTAYQEVVDQAVALLRGDHHTLLRDLRNQRKVASERLDFEAAEDAHLLLLAVEKTLRHPALAPRREARTLLLEELQRTLHLSRVPKHILCVDQSHLSGTAPVGAVISYLGGYPYKKEYRTYRLSKVDEYEGLDVILTRHLRSASQLPDLLLVDGGKAHADHAARICTTCQVPPFDIVAIAKEEHRHDRGLSQEKLFFPHSVDPLILPIQSPLLFLLQEIRDEAHRFVLAFHKKQRGKIHFRSELEGLPGIGPAKRERLLHYCGSVTQIKRLSKEELNKISGLSQKNRDVLWEWIQSCRTNDGLDDVVL